MERIVVSRGAKHKIDCQVDEARSVLRYVPFANEVHLLGLLPKSYRCFPSLSIRWEFVSTNYDIAFGLYYRGDRKQKQELVNYWQFVHK